MFKSLFNNSYSSIRNSINSLKRNKLIKTKHNAKFCSSSQSQNLINTLESSYYISIIPPLQTLDHLESLQMHLQKSLIDTPIRWNDRYHMHIKIRDIPELKDNLNESLLKVKNIMDNVVKGLDPFIIKLERLESIDLEDDSVELLMKFERGEDHLNDLIQRLNDAFLKENLNVNIEPENSIIKHYIPIGKISRLNVTKDEIRSIEASFNAMKNFTSFEAREILLLNKSMIDSHRFTLHPVHSSLLNVPDKGIKRRSRYLQTRF